MLQGKHAFQVNQSRPGFPSGLHVKYLTNWSFTEHFLVLAALQQHRGCHVNITSDGQTVSCTLKLSSFCFSLAFIPAHQSHLCLSVTEITFLSFLQPKKKFHFIHAYFSDLEVHFVEKYPLHIGLFFLFLPPT